MEYQEIISNIKEIGSYIGSGGIGIIAYNFDRITKFISLLCEVGSLKKAWQISRKKRKERGNNITFENDNFARETIKYRFKDIISSLNAEIDLHPELKTKKLIILTSYHINPKIK